MALGTPDSPDKNKYKKLAAAVVMLMIAAGASYFGYASSQPRVVKPGARMAYAYDVKTGKVSAVSATGLTLPGGLVRAHVFSDGDCGNENERWVGYLERMTPEAIKALTEAKAGRAGDIENARAAAEGMQLGDPNSPDRWVSDASEEGIELRSAARADRDGKPVVECRP